MSGPFILGDLADPSYYTSPISIGSVPRDELTAMLHMMATIRVVEEFIGDQVEQGVVKCPCHLAIGQEAVAVGVASALRKTDRVFGTHRSHGHYLAQGGGVYELLAEILGRVTGCSHGMGGSMHLYDASVGFLGSVPIVGATVPLAVGAGLAASMDGRGDVAVAYFGDGAMEEGAVHESLNFASQFKLPVLFVVENNLFSSHLHISERQPFDSVARFAVAHDMQFRVVDGNDVVATAQAAAELVEGARAGRGPGFLEAVTYRWRGHVGASEDQDVGVDRKEGLAQWKERDPISRLESTLVTDGVISPGALGQFEASVRSQCATAWERATADPFPEDDALLDMVYKSSELTR
jgi:TPP-dependent pyruvate/acetoin dehydrogenase alpha subunit